MVNQPGDVFEQEADRTAEAVVSDKSFGSHSSSDALHIRRRALGTAGPANSAAAGEVINSSGRPLDAATRAYMEPRFGYDFSQVRIHSDAQAADSARAVNALAYTAGRDLVFNEGQYRPDTVEGKKAVGARIDSRRATTGSPRSGPATQGRRHDPAQGTCCQSAAEDV